MNKKTYNLYNETYYKLLQELYCWPNWKKEIANTSLLISPYARKLPLYVDGDQVLETLDIIRLVDASYEYLDLDESFDASEEMLDSFPVINNNHK